VRKFTELERAEVWDRWQGGEAMRKIARWLGRESSSVRTLIEDTGGVRPAPRRRASRCLSLTEREEISRGVAAGESLRRIAGRLGRGHIESQPVSASTLREHPATCSKYQSDTHRAAFLWGDCNPDCNRTWW